MNESPARAAAIEAALEMVASQSLIGLGSGRAVFGLCEAIGRRWNGTPPVSAVVASEVTAERARRSGITVSTLGREAELDVAFDGADEIDPHLNMVKGAGAALLREKLVIAAARKVVAMAEVEKLVGRLGETKPLPVEVVRFGWEQTARRLEALAGPGKLRTDETGPLVTDEGNYIIDVAMPAEGDLADLDRQVKGTLGVVEHGLFLGMAHVVLAGEANGSLRTLIR